MFRNSCSIQTIKLDLFHVGWGANCAGISSSCIKHLCNLHLDADPLWARPTSHLSQALKIRLHNLTPRRHLLASFLEPQPQNTKKKTLLKLVQAVWIGAITLLRRNWQPVTGTRSDEAGGRFQLSCSFCFRATPSSSTYICIYKKQHPKTHTVGECRASGPVHWSIFQLVHTHPAFHC